MIQANDLRTGNYLKDKEGLIVKVIGIDSDRQFKHQGVLYLGTAQCYYKEYNGSMGKWLQTLEPIPLTEKILLKCGFTSDGVPVGYTIDNRFQIRHVYDNVAKNTWKWSFEAYDDDNWIGIANPEHLHQLQNLYFALTGKELEVKLCP